MTPPSPLVSAVVIFLNEEQYLREAIDSVFAQTYPHWELLLVDDGSTDGSTAIARGCAAAHPDSVRYLEHEGHQNRGMSATRNLGIRHARGEFVALLDADDVWLPEKFARQVEILQANPSVGMVCGPTLYWHSWTGRPEDRERDFVEDLRVGTDVIIEPPALLTRLYPLGIDPAPCQCSLLIRRSVLDRVGGYEEMFRGFYEDQAFLTKVYLQERVLVSSECTDKYRIHSGSCSAIVREKGDYDAYRKLFLEWFRGYLEAHAVTDPQVRGAVDAALRPYGSGEPTWKWFLRVAEGNVARLSYPAGESDTVRIEIDRNRTDTRYDTQANLPALRLRAGRRYRLAFRYRADRLRTFAIGVARGHSPWTNLGLYAVAEAGPEWQSFDQEFAATEDERDSRIHVDAGGSDAAIELSALVLRDLVDGALVVQERTDQPSAPTERDVVEPPVPVHEVDFGSFRRLTPISRDFGCDRGRPVDRYYIENFLERQSPDVQGRVLEIGESTYTRRFGGDRVTASDVLHVTEGEPQATIIADLTSAPHIPSNTFDCVILTQTLQLIYDASAAVRTIHRILKPGGVLLATFPGISQTYDHEWAGTWYWNFTATSARRLFADIFSSEHARVESFGNVLAAMSFLHGLAVEELTPAELDYRERGYDVTIAVRAMKSEAAALGPSTGAATSTQTGPAVRTGTAIARPVILMYHRIAEGGLDPFSLCVSPAHFSEQLEVLHARAMPVRLDDLVGRATAGGLGAPSSVITFDDGYADNLIHAKPRLERAGVPATVFLTTGYLGGTREFWWDELERLLLTPGEVPPVLELTVNGVRHHWVFGGAERYSEDEWRSHRAWKAHEPLATPRHAAYHALWRLLQFTPHVERESVLRDLAAWAGLGLDARPSHRQLSADELIELVRGDLIEAGGHTVTHPVLASLSTEAQAHEIRQCKSDIEGILGRPVRSFSYPFGSAPDYTAETMAMVREAGFRSACSTRPAPVDARPDLFQLPRLQVEDWDGDEFARRLDGWLAG